MCGIGGIVDKNGQAGNLQEQIQMLSLLQKHRGPDGEGFLAIEANELKAKPCFGQETPEEICLSGIRQKPMHALKNMARGNIAFLMHRHLKILDLSHESHQPMCSPDQKLWIVHNGEIYNYQSLRTELIGKGHHFVSDTDTEVIINAYRQWGRQCVGHFNGMWSFVLYDQEEKSLFISRDRTGVKPLYYFLNNHYFAFASEAKALIRLPFIQHEVNRRKAFDLLVLNDFTNREETLFKQILELPPAHNLCLNLKTWHTEIQSYFQLNTEEKISRYSKKKEEEYSGKIRKLLDEAIRIRLQAKVPIGTCLSGGLDSSAIACSINRLLDSGNYPHIGKQQALFTSGFPNASYNENKWASLVVESTRSAWTKISPSSSEFLSDIETLHYSQDFPISSASSYAQFRVMRAAKASGMRVMMDGQGADELFAGYPHHIDIYNLQLLRLWRLLAWIRENRHQFTTKLSRQARLWAKNRAFSKLNTKHTLQLLSNRYDDLEYINPDLIEDNQERLEWLIMRNCKQLNHQLQKDYSGGYLQYLLKCEDRSSMWHSIESRTPFADDLPLMQLAFAIPPNYKIRKGQGKYILRKAIKGLIPEPIRNRTDKMGFVAPTHEWIELLRQELKPYFTSSLNPWLNVKALEQRYDIFFKVGRKPENRRVFKLISFAVWHKVFFGQGIG